MPETMTLEPEMAVRYDPDEVPRPDVSHLITETEEAVDNIISEKQMRLLTRPLYSSWAGLTDEQGNPRTFVVFANVGLYFGTHEPYLVPDVMLSLDVEVPEDITVRESRVYFAWEYGKPPDVAIEIVSNRKGNEDGSKLHDYAQGGVAYYAIYDPEAWLSDEPLRVYELQGRRYVRRPDSQLPDVGLALTLWQGEFETWTRSWLRWCDPAGNLLLTGTERAEMEKQRADTAEEKAARFAAKLRELGLDPEQV
jgi:Uma2 family endonuclease